MTCQACDGPSRWYLLRFGDAVASWACDEHLVTLVERLQRPQEQTKVSVQRAR